MAQQERTLDVWLVGVIVILVLFFGGSLWFAHKALEVRIEEMSQKVRDDTDSLQIEIFALRRQVQDVDMLLRKVNTQLAAAPVAAPPVARK